MELSQQAKINAAELAATTVSEDDPDLSTGTVMVDGGSAPINAYVAYPASAIRSPGILVIHARYGLEPHFRDLARRLAKVGYAAMTPDLLSPLGGAASFPDHNVAATALETRSPDDQDEDLHACLDQLGNLDGVDADRLGVLGFCAGGTLTWRMVTKEPRLGAAVAFYGSYPALEDVPKIQAPVLAIYGGLDERINAGIPEISKAMADAGKVFEMEIYDGAKHGFHNDQNHNGNYHPEAAPAAWRRATGWFDHWLR